MKILSIDVGIKNLAYCLLETTGEEFQILKWDVVNLSEEKTLTCCFVDPANHTCNKPAKFKKQQLCFCTKHSKNQPYSIPTCDQKKSVLNKHKIAKLHEIANQYQLQYDPAIKKAELLALLHQYIDAHYFEPVEQKKANEIDLFEVGLYLKQKFNEIFKELDNMDYVIIENQIGPLAIRMKTLQGMLVQYFIMSHITVDHIEFISASNKLKDCDFAEKQKYKDRKKMGIAKCLDILHRDPRFKDSLEYFNRHKKKDDLADSLLQGVWFIHARFIHAKKT